MSSMFNKVAKILRNENETDKIFFLLKKKKNRILRIYQLFLLAERKITEY